MLQDMRCVIYCRISSDKVGAGLGVQRQEKECRELAQRLGWTVVDVYVDNDISAFDRRKNRPDWRRMLDDLRSGIVDAVIAWHVDRLYRQPRDLDELIDIIQDKAIPVQTVVSGPLDLSNPSGVAMAKVAAVFAEYESSQKAVRQRSKARELAEAGKVGGGGTRPFGFEDDRKTIRPDETELIREAAQQVLLYGVVKSVVRDWNERGIPTVTGNRWTSHVMRRMLMSARISGRREHQRVGNIGQITGPAEWPGIISPEDSDRLRELLSDPQRLTYDGDSARKYLLTGFLRCGIAGCGLKLISRPQGDRQRSYVCAIPGRSHLRIHAETLELYVSEAAFDYLDEFVNLASAVRDQSKDTREPDLWTELRNYQTRLERVRDAFYVHDRLPESEFNRLSGELDAAIQRTKDDLAKIRQETRLRDFPSSSARARELWPERGFSWRRMLIGTLVERVEVGPGVRGRNRFDPDRIAIMWRKP